MRRMLLAVALLASPAAAMELNDFRFDDPSLSAAMVMDDTLLFVGGASGMTQMPNGSLLAWGNDGSAWRVQQIEPDGTVRRLFSVLDQATDDGCSGARTAAYAPADGSMFLGVACPADDHVQLWRIAGLPRINSGAPPFVPGDISPGTLDPSTDPPTFRPGGDGRVTIADVVKALRVSVGLEQLSWAP